MACDRALAYVRELLTLVGQLRGEDPMKIRPFDDEKRVPKWVHPLNRRKRSADLTCDPKWMPEFLAQGGTRIDALNKEHPHYEEFLAEEMEREEP